MKNKKNNELAVCGFAAVKTLEKNDSSKITRIYFTEDKASLFGGLCKSMAKRKAPYNIVKDVSELEKLSGSVHHQGVVAMIEAPEILPLDTDIVDKWYEDKEDALILDHVGNANNLGAIVRSAAFFGIKNIVIPFEEAQSSITTSSYRVAEGGMEFVNIYSIKSITSLLEAVSGKFVRLGTDLKAKRSVEEIKKISGGKPTLVILGNEENGISSEVRRNCDELIIIPFSGMTNGKASPVDSLNVAQAASIILYEMKKKLDGNN